LLEAARGCDYPIVILGSGPLESELRAQAEALGLCNVHFLGWQSDEDKVALLTLCTAMVFPSHLRSEAFGVALVEGTMYGKPMISCEIGTGTTFVNIAGETGLVVPPADAVALREAMRTLWDQPLLAAEMGQRARLRFEQVFTAKAMLASYSELYKSLLGR
jgi:glycosyltransferase involved in cell wall biosynthesis